MGRRTILPVVLTALALSTAACSQQEAELTTTTTVISPSEVTSTDAVSTTTTTDAGSEDTATTEAGVADYQTVVRSATNRGEVLWILIPPADYTDIDLENLIRVIVDRSDAPLDGINVFDDADALEAGRVDPEARTADEQALVDTHFLVSLVDGAVIRYQGPFADLGDVAVGS